MAVGFLAILVFTGCTKQQEEPEVESVIAIPKSFTEASGKVIVEERTSIYLDFPATVEEVYVKEGDKVAKGTPLFKLNLEDYNSLLTQKQNEKKCYEMELMGLDKVSTPQTSSIDQIKKQLETKEAALEENTDTDLMMLQNTWDLLEDTKKDLLKDYDTAKELLAIGAISQKEISSIEQSIRSKNKDMDDVQLKIEQTRAAKKEEITNLKTQLKELNTQVNNTESTNDTTKDKLQLQMDTIDLQIQTMETKLQVPYLQDGVVIATEDECLVYEIAVEKGTKTQNLMTPAFKTADMTKLVVEVDVPEAYSDELQVGSKVSVIPYINEEKVLEGTVVRISQQVVENYGETVVKMIIEVDDQDNLLKLGGSVDIQF